MPDREYGAWIYKIGDQPTDPYLLMDMVKANVRGVKSAVVSVMIEDDNGNQSNRVFTTQMQNGDLAFHKVCIDEELRFIWHTPDINQ